MSREDDGNKKVPIPTIVELEKLPYLEQIRILQIIYRDGRLFMMAECFFRWSLLSLRVAVVLALINLSILTFDLNQNLQAWNSMSLLFLALFWGFHYHAYRLCHQVRGYVYGQATMDERRTHEGD